MNKDLIHLHANIHPEKSDKFWEQFKNETPRCSVCHKLKEPDIKYVDLGDGRKLCSYCYSITIMDPEECEAHIFENVHRFYKSLDLNVDEDIPILLVDGDEMSRVGKLNKQIKALGMAVFTAGNSKPIMTINRCTKYEDKIEVEKKANKVTKWQLLAAFCGSEKEMRLLLLFGRPDVLMGMTLAHEMMHAWLSLQGLTGSFNLERCVEEGICQVMSKMYGEWFCSRSFEYSSYKTKEQLEFTITLCKYYTQLAENHSNEIYRKGLNQVMGAIKEYTFKTTLEHIVEARCLPRTEAGAREAWDAEAREA